jgi:hypothetical protein
MDVSLYIEEDGENKYYKKPYSIYRSFESMSENLLSGERNEYQNPMD